MKIIDIFNTVKVIAVFNTVKVIDVFNTVKVIDVFNTVKVIVLLLAVFPFLVSRPCCTFTFASAKPKRENDGLS